MKINITQAYITNYRAVEFISSKQKTTYSVFLRAKITTYSIFEKVNFTTYSIF